MEKALMKDNSYMFKNLTNLNPPTYDGTITLRHLRIGFGACKSCLMPYNALRSRRYDLLVLA